MTVGEGMNWINKILVKPPPAKKGEINYSLFDRFTFVHLAIGFGYGAMALSFGAAFALAWEFFENPLKVHFAFLFPHSSADTFQNMVGDILALNIGWLIHHYAWTGLP